MKLKALLGILALAMSSAAPLGAASAQDYPAKPITMVVPFGAGSGGDTTARILAEGMAAKLGQPIVIENKPGASGVIGAQAVQHAAPDGYTILFVSSSTHGTNPSLVKDLPYDPAKDFSAIGSVVNYVFVMTVDPKLGMKTAKEIVDYAKANPGKLSYASGSPTSRLMAEVFKKVTGTDITYVAYKTSPQAMADVVGGRVSMMFTDLTASTGFLKANSLLAVGVTSAKRSSILPDLPALTEQIDAPFDFQVWTGLVAPAGTPEPVVAKLNEALNAALEEPEIRQRLSDLGSDIIPSTPADFGAFIASEVQRLAGFVKDAGLKAQ